MLIATPPNPTRDTAYYQALHETNAAYQNNNWLLDELDAVCAFGADSVLELACGNGRFLVAAADRFARVVGCDWARSPLLEPVLAAHANVAFFRTDLYHELPPCQAELVVSADFLEHLAPESLEAVLRRIDPLGAKAFHKVACYDDHHSHLSILEPGVWLELFTAVNPAYRLLRVAERDGDPTRTTAVFVKGWPA